MALKPYALISPRQIALASISFIVTVIALTIFSSPSTAALSGGDFDPGRIIDDSVFYNDSRMSVSQIQQFLDSKIPDCDTNGEQSIYGTTRAAYGASQGYPPPYTCINEYSQSISGVNNSSTDLCTGDVSAGTKSAAQIIHDVAQACRINPQVLIVMLQKEQSLITDTWPWPSQYDKAMGYACPDTGPNNSANCDSAYFGFFNQVYNAAQAFRRYEANPNSYNYRPQANNFILYNPNTACGGSTVYIENQATANLYIYTPYQPNQAALDNLYGTGDGCSAYGNRNFWRLFNDWFGPTSGTPMFKVAGDNKTYISGANDTYYHVQTTEIREAYGYGKRFTTIESVGTSFIEDKTYAGVLTWVSDFEGSDHYLIDRSGKYVFNDSTVFEDDFGYSTNDISHLDSSSISYFPDAGAVRNIITEYEGDAIFLAENGTAREFVDSDAYASGSPSYSSLPFVRLSKDYIDTLPVGSALIGSDAIIRTTDKGSYKYWDGSLLYSIPRGLYNNLSGRLTVDYQLHSEAIASLPRAPQDLTSLVNDGTSYSILDENRKLTIPSAQLAAYGLQASDFVSAPTNLFASVPSAQMTQIVAIEGSGSKYHFIDGELRYFDSFGAVQEQGLDYNSITVLQPETAAYVMISSKIHFQTGTMFKIVGSPRTYITNSSSSRLYIDSSALLQDFGRTSNTRTFQADWVADLPETGELVNLSRDNSNNVWVIHSNGTAQNIPTRLLDSSRMDIDPSSLNKLSSRIINSKQIIEPVKDLLRDSLTRRVYYVENGLKRHIQSPAAITNLGYTYDDITIVSNVYASSIPDGLIIE